MYCCIKTNYLQHSLCRYDVVTFAPMGEGLGMSLSMQAGQAYSIDASVSFVQLPALHVYTCMDGRYTCICTENATFCWNSIRELMLCMNS